MHALACVALGRCVVFGRPKMSVRGHAGARSAPAKVACISFTRPLFGITHLMFLFRFFCLCFRRPCRCPTKILSRHSMDTLNCAPDGASARSRSPSRSLEAAPQHPHTTPIRVTESQELVITHARQCACLGNGHRGHDCTWHRTRKAPCRAPQLEGAAPQRVSQRCSFQCL